MRAVRLLTVASVVALACAPSSRGPERVEEGAVRPIAVPLRVEAAPLAAAPIAEMQPVEAPPLAPRPTSRHTLATAEGHLVEVYPPLDTPTETAPLVVFLHATCMWPLDVCDFWSKGGREGNWLVCPAGPSICYGAPDWSGTPKVKADALAEALGAVDTAYGPWIDREKGDVLIGYSRGAFAARDILYEGSGRFRGLILLSAAISPDPARLKAAGIRRAVLATGDLDGSRATMLRAAQKLDAAGIPTKFVSLGKIGHWLPEGLEPILRDAIAWVATPVS